MTESPNGVDIHTIGYILLVVGILGMLISLVFWSSSAGPGYFVGRRDYVDDAPVRRRRRVIDEDIV